MAGILMMPAKLATGGLKIKAFWYKVYDVIISVHNFTKGILLRDSNHIGNVVMWPNNTIFTMREVIVTLIL